MSFLENIGVATNPVLERLPKHLLQFVKAQNYEQYTDRDQAIWRYVMRKNVSYLQSVAHESYLDGLLKCGISVDAIPTMYGMNRILEKIGWAAVAVDGLIPTAAFLEFQAYNVLVIASDIRTLEDIEYTPVPDIIHESAGHAPIIANPEYAEFLRRLGQIGCRAISAPEDDALQQAVRTLTELKTAIQMDRQAIEAAEKEVVALQQKQELSEMNAIKNLHWWSVEYGLVGSVDDYKIYGAGLLSSIGESKWCQRDQVKKLPYSIETAKQNFDYTKPQPQLFVTPDFAHLSYVIEDYANQMALRTGGLKALRKLIHSRQLGTIELSTGIQITGYFDSVLPDEQGNIAYFSTKGPTALANRDQELIGHGTLNHPNGFGSPIGKLRGINLAIEDMYPLDLEAYHIYEGRNVKLEFASGVMVEGQVITGIRNRMGKIMLIRFRNCTVRFREELLFLPIDGVYDMAVGKEVISGYAGTADNGSFDLLTHTIREDVIKSRADSEENRLLRDYSEIRLMRNSGIKVDPDLIREISARNSKEWLLLLGCLELSMLLNDQSLQGHIQITLDSLSRERPQIAHLIAEGVANISK